MNACEIDSSFIFPSTRVSYLTREGSDRMRWKLKSSEDFIVRPFNEFLWVSQSISFPWKAIGRTKDPKKVYFFVWTAARGEFLSMRTSSRGGYSMVSRCCMCCCSGEIINNLLIHCSAASELWSLIFMMFGVYWVLPEKVPDLVCEW